MTAEEVLAVLERAEEAGHFAEAETDSEATTLANTLLGDEAVAFAWDLNALSGMRKRWCFVLVGSHQLAGRPGGRR